MEATRAHQLMQDKQSVVRPYDRVYSAPKRKEILSHAALRMNLRDTTDVK